MEFARGKITAAIPQIGAEIAQDVDELQSLAVLHAQLAHLRFGLSLDPSRARTEPGPVYPRRPSGHEIGVFVEIGGGRKRLHFRAAETLQVEHLSAIDFLQNSAHLASIALLQGLEPGERSGQRIDRTQRARCAELRKQRRETKASAVSAVP